MLDSFVYENHLGQRFEGLKNGVYLNYSDIRDYEWNYETINNKISRFYMDIRSRKIPLVVVGKTDEEATTIKNHLLDLAEADIVAKLPGKIYVGEFYTHGYITGSVKSNYLLTKRLTQLELTMTSDDPKWYKEHQYAFIAGGEEITDSKTGTDYPYDYSYDYGLYLRGRRIACPSVGSHAFRLLVYGPAENPAITINAHTYVVNGRVNAGETLLVDSITKTITLTTANGNKINWFDKRGREDYIFEPIPAGQNIVNWIGTYGFDLTVIEQRSEPRWT